MMGFTQGHLKKLKENKAVTAFLLGLAIDG
jgi:hypothetical protein